MFRKGDYAQAINWGREAIALARRARDDRLLAYAHNMLSNAYIESGRLRDATRHLRPAVRLYHELGDYSGQASANNNLGSCYQLLGMYDAALYHYEMAELADERSGDEIDSAIVHNNMAETLLLLDREEEAVARLEQVLHVADKEPDLADLSAWAHVATGRAYRALGRLAEANQHLRKGVRQLRALESRGLLAEALVDVAEQSLAEGDTARARRQAMAALKHSRDVSARLPEARALRVLGECDTQDGRPSAEPTLRESVQLCRRVQAGHEEARALVALARYYIDKGRLTSAQRPLRRAHRVFRRAGATRQARNAETLLSEAAA
jgi:tetratricopeptide (TPR) repeat protein